MSLDPILATQIGAFPFGQRTVAPVAALVARADARAGSCDHPGRAEG